MQLASPLVVVYTVRYRTVLCWEALSIGAVTRPEERRSPVGGPQTSTVTGDGGEQSCAPSLGPGDRRGPQREDIGILTCQASQLFFKKVE
jgi:hypothetical protein